MSLVRYMLQKTSQIFMRSFSFTSRLNDIYYTTDHETVLTDEDTNIVKIGISDYARETLGDIVFLETEVEIDDTFEEGEAIVSIESVKASSEVFAPFDGKVVDVNEIEDLDTISELSEDQLWFVSCEIDDFSILNNLMCNDEYNTYISKID